jgi:UDP-N-acetylglucosamine 2-epimerase
MTVVGARPQFIKAAPLSKELRRHFQEIIIHTGQHYDSNMSEVFFTQLEIPLPDINLEVGSGSHAYQTGTMLIKLEEVFVKYQPDCIIIYGDTNSTIAASLAAVKLQIPVAHVEAGLRIFDFSTPEAVNRVVADKLSQFLFAPTKTAVVNLKKEGITENVYLTGDVMYDALLYGLSIAEKKSDIISGLKLGDKVYSLCTIHRAKNTDNVQNLQNIINALGAIEDLIVFPVHPRTQKVITSHGINIPNNVQMIPSVGYLDFIMLEKCSHKIITDSGGVQREAYWLKKPCITISPRTSWVETVEDGWNTLVDADQASIVDGYHAAIASGVYKLHFGDGYASLRIADILKGLI